MLPRFIQDFGADLGQFIRATEPFAFVRFHDGEYALLQGVPYDAKSGWSVDGPTWIQFPLEEALVESQLDNYYIGISPPCDHSEAAAWYRPRVKLPKWKTTFATIFQGANYKKVHQLTRKYENPFIVACKNADVTVPENGLRKGWDVNAVVEKLLRVEGRTILVSAGPLANIIIHKYWKTQDPLKRTTIIDIGSAIDIDIHGKPTRRFHNPDSPERNHVCDWETWHAHQPMSGRRRERASRRTSQSETFRQLAEAGFTGTTGCKDKATEIHRRPAPGIQSASVRDQEVPNSGNKNVRIRPNKK